MSAESKPTIDALMREAFAHHEAGELARAREGYRRILDLEPQHPEALFLLGEIANREGRHAEAVAYLQPAVAAQPDTAAFHFELADALMRLRRHDEANPHYRKVLRLKIAAEAPDARAGLPAVAVPRTTLCCVDCVHHDLAAYALRRSSQTCRFERALFLTDRPMRIEGVETVLIPPIASLEDYSRFMIKELDRYIDTDFALVIQYDGFVIDGSRWSDEFQDYDYVGARWNLGPTQDVGNGGFSLRSKRLLRALQDEAIDEFFPEDQMICRRYRSFLETRYGIRFAPEALAERFAFETAKPRGPTFGFHGLGHLASMIDMSAEEIARYQPPKGAGVQFPGA